ncbi:MULTISPECIES: 3-isopropylmalate dehydratase [Tepidanaerobacter]|uniref:LeuD/DmdB family oxidoreductase small subunit n=1 Tax=Tepidanaerobacter sp. EBM-38 TaxID=1918496 RepID=UPI00020C0062|nr:MULTISPECIES: 3-isopropylmalate dehydratase [Tepidanaerobacter]AEE90602.1 3-isopropylmalate dehydratase small subunit [Tepidanaerobacter acetatoxydans Re1]
MKKVKGRVFFLGDNIDTDQILPGYAMSVPACQLKNYALKGSSIPDFVEKVRPGDVIIGGKNFGCGSSREQAPVALKDAGVGAVIAASFAMIFRKNSINIGLPVITSECIDLMKREIQEGDQVEVDIESGILLHIDSGRVYELKKLSEPALATLRAGGLINRVRDILCERGELIDCKKA